MDTGCLHPPPADPSSSEASGDASSACGSASASQSTSARRSRGVRLRLRLRRRRQEPAPAATPGGEGQGGAGVQVQDDLALPLGMSFAAVLAQVRAAIRSGALSVAFPISGAGGEVPTCVYVRILPFTVSTELYVILLATMHRVGPHIGGGRNAKYRRPGSISFPLGLQNCNYSEQSCIRCQMWQLGVREVVIEPYQ